MNPIKKIHIIAICGTGMSSLAGMLKNSGYEITGSDDNVYPPVSTQLEKLKISYFRGFKPSNLDHNPDLIIVGNAMSRGNPEIEAMLDRGLKHTSFPQALCDFYLKDKHSVVIAGTHGKTTTSAIVAWVLESVGLDPSFMIGGITKNFHNNYKLGMGKYFVVEGDEYDTAFFDKTPKFLHYRPRSVLLTSLEFDHADIYKNLDQIKEEFKRLIKLIPNGKTGFSANQEAGLLIACVDDPQIREVIQRFRGLLETYGFSGDAYWKADNVKVAEERTLFTVYREEEKFGDFSTSLIGRHNVQNLLGATALLNGLGLSVKEIQEGLKTFQGVRRRQELIGNIHDRIVLDDFAHHPTAVRETINAIRSHYPDRRLWAIFEPRSATNRRNIFQKDYIAAFKETDEIIIADVHLPERVPEGERFSSDQLAKDLIQEGRRARHISGTDSIISYIIKSSQPGDVILCMSNGGFDGLPMKLVKALYGERNGEGVK
jgi:UDP-N-acetylmuramate: L-alanyl-gamma-D-glutamyl-meso-diaminopimelate ligase